jgi:hydrogenase large subunit
VAIVIDPVTRIEGHLGIEVTLSGGTSGTVSDVKSRGEMFRGFENFLKNRAPGDAIQATQRICGV